MGKNENLVKIYSLAGELCEEADHLREAGKEGSGYTTKEKARDEIRNDMKMIRSVIGEGIEKVGTEEINELLAVLFWLRDEKEILFYRKENGYANSTSRKIHSNITRGKLEYRYEEYYKMLIKIYNRKFGKNIPNDVERGILELAWGVQNQAKEFIIAICSRNKESIQLNWKKLWGGYEQSRGMDY